MQEKLQIDCGFCGAVLGESQAKMCRCKTAVYCGESCQAGDWEQHRADCRGMFSGETEGGAADREESFCGAETPEGGKAVSLAEKSADYENSAAGEKRFVIDMARFGHNKAGKGIKKVLLKYKYNVPEMCRFDNADKRWKIKNFVVQPPDGTFMLLERSYFEVENFLSVTFDADFMPAKILLQKIKTKLNNAKQNRHKESSENYIKTAAKEVTSRQKYEKLRESYPETIEEFLLNGVRVINSRGGKDDGVYHFAGHSNSQLRTTSCYLLRAQRSEIYQTLHSIGKFEAVDDLAKLVKCIGLLFTTVKSPLILCGDDYRVEPDVKSPDGKYCFTDGCGRAPTRVMRALMGQMRLPLQCRTISAVQVRFKGFKGMLVHDPRASQVVFAESMLKFRDRAERAPIGVCNWSRPHLPGYLILQYVVLLSTLGVPDWVFERKQREYYGWLENMASDPYKGYSFAKHRSPALAAQFKRRGLCAEVIAGLRALKREELTRLTRARNRRQSGADRVRIFVPKSRNAHGVRDTAGALRYGEVFFCPTMADGSTRPLRGQLLTARTPCYSPGDVRILRCVDPGARYAHLRDVLVFPARAGDPRPHADEMSGGDLDGDLFWCCWDPLLFPPRLEAPCDYSAPGAEWRRGGYAEEAAERVRFFARHDSGLLGSVDKLFFEYADRFMADCDECRELNEVFARVVDNDPSSAKEVVDRLREKLRVLNQKPRDLIWRRIEAENSNLREKLSPCLGVLNRSGNRPSIMTSDFDEPIFLRDGPDAIAEMAEGTVVSFTSKWDSFSSRFFASNIVPQFQLDQSHLYKNVNINLCEGKINSIAGKSQLCAGANEVIGTILFRADYMRALPAKMEEEDIPICQIGFTSAGLAGLAEEDIISIGEGQLVSFNLVYTVSGELLATEISLERQKGVEGHEKPGIIRNAPRKLDRELGEQIRALVEKHKFLWEEEFASFFCLEFAKKIDLSFYGKKSAVELVEEVKDVAIKFDSAGNAFFIPRKTDKKCSEKWWLSLHDDVPPGDKFLRDLRPAEDWLSDTAEALSDTEKSETRDAIECFYCGQEGHIPYDCARRFENYNFPGCENSESDCVSGGL